MLYYRIVHSFIRKTPHLDCKNVEGRVRTQNIVVKRQRTIAGSFDQHFVQIESEVAISCPHGKVVVRSHHEIMVGALPKIALLVRREPEEKRFAGTVILWTLNDSFREVSPEYILPSILDEEDTGQVPIWLAVIV